MAGVAITPGSGATVAADTVGSATTPASGERTPYMKLDGGGGGLSAPVENATAANLAAATTPKALLASAPGQWVETHAPAANTQATKSKAAGGAGVRHVCTGLVVTLANGAAAPTAALVTVNLRDGATGAGTILATFTLAVEAVAGKVVALALSGLNVPGTANTAMTLETSAAPGANVSASVTLFGTSAS
jgi:hypothetical protein